MEIRDSNKNLLAIVHYDNNFVNGKNFYTQPESEFQFGSFSLNEGEEIIPHIHEPQERNISKTSEGIVVISGEITVQIYSVDKIKVCDLNLVKGDALLILDGGHSLKMNKDTKFVEFKQGPYHQEIDKERF